MKFHVAAALFLCTPALAQLPAEDFTLGNTSGWSLNNGPNVAHNATGGNPGGCLNVPGMGVNTSGSGLMPDLLRPTAPGHPWRGNFRAMEVERFSFNFKILSGSSLAGDEWAVYLADDNGTATQDDDAFIVAEMGFLIDGPTPWLPVAKSIPSDWTVLPTGWWTQAMPNSPLLGLSHNARWNTIITNVDYVGIGAGPPSPAFPLGSFDTLFDNFRLQGEADPFGTFCYPGDINSTGNSAELTGALSPLGHSNLHLDVQGGPPGELGYFLVGSGMVDPGVVLSDGHLCLGVAIGRYNVQGTPLNSVGRFDNAGVFKNLSGTSAFNNNGFDVPFLLPLPGMPIIQSGETWYFQLWHRDTASGPGRSNFSNGFGLTFP